jgi:transcriptional regulator with XRE-family HTH domain
MSFREILATELGRRRARNRRYSLRALARDLGIDHATLSQLMRGVRRITPRMIEALAAPLGLTAADVARHSADAVDAALLAAVARPGFKTSSRWIAVRLGISIDDINIALHRLLHQRRLAMTEVSEWTAR